MVTSPRVSHSLNPGYDRHDRGDPDGTHGAGFAGHTRYALTTLAPDWALLIR